MEREQFIRALFERAKEKGITDCEVYYAASSGFECDVFGGEVTDYSVSETAGLGFRVLVDGKMGYAGTQAMDEDSVALLVDSALSNARLIEDPSEQFLYDGSGEYADLPLFDPEQEKVTASEKLAAARDMERRTLAVDPRITQVQGCGIFSESEERMIVNTRGLRVSSRANVMGGYVAAVAKEGDQVASGSELFIAEGADLSGIGIAAESAAGTALDHLSAVSLPSGEYKVIFSGKAMTSLLGTFSGIFSADQAQKGLSLLKGKEGTNVAAECVTVVDDPLLPGSASSSPFDGEGVPTRRKEVISNGTLNTLLHDLKTAKKQGVTTTGNAHRASYTSPVTVAPVNFFLQPGSLSPEELYRRMEDGIVICEMQGMHAGADPISGDFSLGAKGYRVEHGEVTGAVKEITVAGNFYSLLQSISAVGSDLHFGTPGSSRFGSPSVLAGMMSIAGK